MLKRLAKRFPSPSEFTLAVLEGKWKATILRCLSERPRRFAELRRLTPRLSDKMLSERLRELTAAGLVVRQATQSERIQTYALSGRGQSLEALLRHLTSWGVEHAWEFKVSIGGEVVALSGAVPELTPADQARATLDPHIGSGALRDSP